MTNISNVNNGIVDGLSEKDLLNQTLEESLQAVREHLTQFATTPDLLEKMQLSFGESFDTELAQNLAKDWASGDFSAMPEIEILDSDTLKGANGAFSIDTNTIYLSREYLENSDLQAVSNVLLEEIGHFVDSSLNSSDAAGDEGALFSSIVLDKSLSKSQIQEIKSENDSAIINIDGQDISIEQSVNGIKTALDTLEGILGQIEGTLKNGILNSLPVFGSNLKNTNEVSKLLSAIDKLQNVIVTASDFSNIDNLAAEL
jgi:hypothetical protein